MPEDIDAFVFGGIPLVVSDLGTPDENDKRLLERRNQLENFPGAMPALFGAIRHLGLGEGRIGVDERNFTRKQYGELEAQFPKAQVLDGYEVFRTIRAVKTPEEVRRLHKSVQACEAGLKKALAILKAGVTERDLERAFFAGVGEAGGMPIIAVICSGQRSAHTNTTPSDRKIKEGDVVRFDLGARYALYPSDLARTYVVGKANATQNLYWDTIVAAEEAAMEAMRPGVLAGEIFDIAVETARRTGLPNFKRQHVGHGIGIDLYDMPILTPKNETPIEEGMVFCIETPCYEIGFAGFQVEDTMVVRSNGVELLSSLPRDMAYRGE
jgi:Xaa-Pro aminopeptidase